MILLEVFHDGQGATTWVRQQNSTQFTYVDPGNIGLDPRVLNTIEDMVVDLMTFPDNVEDGELDPRLAVIADLIKFSKPAWTVVVCGRVVEDGYVELSS